jgi:hypothetical protein
MADIRTLVRPPRRDAATTEIARSAAEPAAVRSAFSDYTFRASFPPGRCSVLIVSADLRDPEALTQVIEIGPQGDTIRRYRMRSARSRLDRAHAADVYR